MNKPRLLVTSLIGITLGSASALAFMPSTPSIATEEPPIVQQVEDHEQRIGTLETRVDSTEAQVQQNTGDIVVLKSQGGGSSSSGGSTGGTGSTGGSGGTTPTPVPTPQPDPTPEPEPTPEPPMAPRTIIFVNEYIEGSLRACDYTLYDARQNHWQGVILQPIDRPCLSVGEIAP